MDFKVFDLGLINFETAWHFQKSIFNQVKDDTLPSALIICQHYPVITLGRFAQKKNILASSAQLKMENIQTFEIERGGDVTYHGPGQLTAYPIFNLNALKKDIHWYLRKLEAVIMACLNEFYVQGQSLPGLTGIWLKTDKIASIGIAVRHWISYHGLSININKEDLANFSLINPCGMQVKMTCLETAAGREISLIEVKEKLISKFSETFEINLIE